MSENGLAPIGAFCFSNSVQVLSIIMGALRSKQLFLKTKEAINLETVPRCLFSGVLTPSWRSIPQKAGPISLHPRRGAKTRASMKVKDLPQGVIEAGPLPELEADNAPQYPAVVQGAKNNMTRFSDCVVLTRVGNFYEVFLHQQTAMDWLTGSVIALSRACREVCTGS
jgi:hypothetical protein